MFGHTQKKSNNVSQEQSTKDNSTKNNLNSQKHIIQKPVIPTNVKVVDFQKKSEKENKIKVKYF